MEELSRLLPAAINDRCLFVRIRRSSKRYVKLADRGASSRHQLLLASLIFILLAHSRGAAAEAEGASTTSLSTSSSSSHSGDGTIAAEATVVSNEETWQPSEAHRTSSSPSSPLKYVPPPPRPTLQQQQEQQPPSPPSSSPVRLQKPMTPPTPLLLQMEETNGGLNRSAENGVNDGTKTKTTTKEKSSSPSKKKKKEKSVIDICRYSPSPLCQIYFELQDQLESNPAKEMTDAAASLGEAPGGDIGFGEKTAGEKSSSSPSSQKSENDLEPKLLTTFLPKKQIESNASRKGEQKVVEDKEERVASQQPTTTKSVAELNVRDIAQDGIVPFDASSSSTSLSSSSSSLPFKFNYNNSQPTASSSSSTPRLREEEEKEPAKIENGTLAGGAAVAATATAATSRDPKSQDSSLSEVRVLPPDGFLETREQQHQRLPQQQVMMTPKRPSPPDETVQRRFLGGMPVEEKEERSGQAKSGEQIQDFSSLIAGRLSQTKKKKKGTKGTKKKKNKKDSANRRWGSPLLGAEGVDFPVYDAIPPTSFLCYGRAAGYYADPEAQCQVYHYCHFDGRQDSFLCPKGTIFNQEVLVCDWWYNADCSVASDFYGINDYIYSNSASPGSPFATSSSSSGSHGNDDFDFFSLKKSSKFPPSSSSLVPQVAKENLKQFQTESETEIDQERPKKKVFIPHQRQKQEEEEEEEEEPELRRDPFRPPPLSSSVSFKSSSSPPTHSSPPLTFESRLEENLKTIRNMLPHEDIRKVKPSAAAADSAELNSVGSGGGQSGGGQSGTGIEDYYEYDEDEAADLNEFYPEERLHDAAADDESTEKQTKPLLESEKKKKIEEKAQIRRGEEEGEGLEGKLDHSLTPPSFEAPEPLTVPRPPFPPSVETGGGGGAFGSKDDEVSLFGEGQKGGEKKKGDKSSMGFYDSLMAISKLHSSMKKKKATTTTKRKLSSAEKEQPSDRRTLPSSLVELIGLTMKQLNEEEDRRMKKKATAIIKGGRRQGDVWYDDDDESEDSKSHVNDKMENWLPRDKDGSLIGKGGQKGNESRSIDDNSLPIQDLLQGTIEVPQGISANQDDDSEMTLMVQKFLMEEFKKQQQQQQESGLTDGGSSKHALLAAAAFDDVLVAEDHDHDAREADLKITDEMTSPTLSQAQPPSSAAAGDARAPPAVAAATAGILMGGSGSQGLLQNNQLLLQDDNNRRNDVDESVLAASRLPTPQQHHHYSQNPSPVGGPRQMFFPSSVDGSSVLLPSPPHSSSFSSSSSSPFSASSSLGVSVPNDAAGQQQQQQQSTSYNNNNPLPLLSPSSSSSLTAAEEESNVERRKGNEDGFVPLAAAAAEGALNPFPAAHHHLGLHGKDNNAFDTSKGGISDDGWHHPPPQPQQQQPRPQQQPNSYPVINVHGHQQQGVGGGPPPHPASPPVSSPASASAQSDLPPPAAAPGSHRVIEGKCYLFSQAHGWQLAAKSEDCSKIVNPSKYEVGAAAEKFGRIKEKSSSSSPPSFWNAVHSFPLVRQLVNSLSWTTMPMTEEERPRSG